MLSRWFIESKGTVQAYLWEDNEAVVEWLQEELRKDNSQSIIKQNCVSVKQDHHSQQIKHLLEDSPRLAMESLVHMTEVISASERKELLTLLLKQEEAAAANSEK